MDLFDLLNRNMEAKEWEKEDEVETEEAMQKARVHLSQLVAGIFDVCLQES